MRNRILVLAALSALVAATFSPAQATPVSASMSVTGHVELDADSASDPETTAWGTLLDPLSLIVDAELTGVGGASASATASADAVWGAGGNSGSVTFGYGLASLEGGATHYEADLNSAGPDWSYTFTADTDGIFSMTYSVTVSLNTVDPAGLFGWNIGWSGPGNGLNLQNASDPTASGVFTRTVLSGQAYTVTLDNNANISCDCGFGSRVMNGEFDFTIAPQAVPEPATVALFGAGLLALGWLLRRRKTHKD